MNPEFGLRETDLFTIRSILAKYSAVEEAYIFGSRAKGNYKNGSDVDIALKGEKLTLQIINTISYELNEETNMPYKFDVLNYHSILEVALTSHIHQVGKLFFTKNKKM